MIVIANGFPKLQTGKDLVKPICRKRCFRTSFDSQHVDGCQKLVKSAWEHFYHIFSSFWEAIILKKFPLLKLEILGVLVNTLAADENYSFADSGDLEFPIQTQLS